MTDHWYYRWLDDYDMSSGNTKPLESECDLWLAHLDGAHSLPYTPLPYSSLALHDPTLCTPFPE